MKSVKRFNYNASNEASTVLQHGFDSKTNFNSIEEMTPGQLLVHKKERWATYCYSGGDL